MLMQPHARTSSPRPPGEDAETKLEQESPPIDAQSPQAVILEGTKCYNAFAQITVLLEDAGKPENGRCGFIKLRNAISSSFS